jgi:hypothetical protein
MWALAVRLLSVGRGARLQAALPVVAVAVATTLLLLTLGAWRGFDARATRTAWRVPQQADDPTALLALRTDYVRDRPISIVELAALGQGAPVPPGMDHVPAPGELWVSPALAGLLRTLPADQLADRFRVRASGSEPAGGELRVRASGSEPAGGDQRSGEPTGMLATRSVAHPDELVAVIGRAPNDAAMTTTRHALPDDDLQVVPATGIASWSTTPDARAEMYILLARIGVMLMVVPLLALGGSASRLVAARRNRRLSLLRLMGGSVGQVMAVTAAETGALGAVGALLGGLAYVVSLPLAAHVPIGGGGWFVADIWVGPMAFAATLLAVVAMVVASAVINLLPVARQPFATARAQRAGGARVWRLAAMAAAVAVFWLNSDEGWRNVALPLGLVLVSFAVAGPWAIRVLGLVIARTARRAPTLLAGRRLIEDPRSGWRAVAGMVLAAFIAGYMAVAVPGDVDLSLFGPADRLRLVVPAADAEAVAGEARDRLAAADVGAEVTLDDPPFWAADTDRTVWIAAAGHGGTLDRARTALTDVVPGAVARTPVDDSRVNIIIFDDVRVGAIVVLVAAFLVAAVSAGVGGIARVLDQQGTLTLVRLAGAPVSALAAARRREVVAPLALCGGGAGLLGVGLGALTIGGIGVAPDSRWTTLFAGLAAAGVVAVLGADLLSRPVLRRATADLSERE